MKYWNKKKEHRSWTKVSVSDVDYKKEKFLWCKRQPSTGKFYRYYGASSWWFEYPEDAVMFSLRFA